MKELIVIRHAKSSWKDENLTDFQRPLNKRGKRDAPFIGSLLNKMIQTPDLIISSPATRAYSTAKLIAKELNYPVDKIKKDIKIYLAEEVELFKIVKKVSDKYQRIILVGHNPGITDFCNMLSNFQIENLPTAGVIKFQFDLESWEKLLRKTGEVDFFEFPKKYLEVVKKED